MGCPPPQSPWPLSRYACLGLQLWIHFSRIPLSAFSYGEKARVPSLFCCRWFSGFCFVKDLTNNCLPFLPSPHSTYPNRNYVFVHSWGFKDQLCTEDFHLSPADFSPELQIPIGNFLLHIFVWMDFTNSNWQGTERLIPTTPIPLPTCPSKIFPASAHGTVLFFRTQALLLFLTPLSLTSTSKPSGNPLCSSSSWRHHHLLSELLLWPLNWSPCHSASILNAAEWSY